MCRKDSFKAIMSNTDKDDTIKIKYNPFVKCYIENKYKNNSAEGNNKK
jgi:hypothetical protein